MQQLNIFIGQSLKHFIGVGSIFPSSTFLAKRMTKNIKCPVVLELGPGTGVFTKEILKRLPKDGRLISIENNEIFTKYLKEKIKDKRLRLCFGDALMLKKILNENGIKKVDCIISGLPIGVFKKEDKEKLMKQITECLSNDGVYIQFEYFLAGIRSVREFFPSVSLSYEILNLPPAFIMRCKKFKK